MPVVTITSIDQIPIDQHCRVSAGPGAGKTTFLVSHIKNILKTSDKLDRTKKVCCITYTNIAVDTILRRLDFATDKVEVSTIHSFIYKHIIKPYGKFIAADFDLAIEKIDGHEDHLVSQKKVAYWINNHPNAASFTNPYTANQMTLLDNNKEGIANWLRSLSYKLNGNVLELVANDSDAYFYTGANRRNIGKANCLDKLRPGLMDYKKIFWTKGVLHHEDVLFFGYILLTRFPFILTVIRAKFPYFLIDEFQDTSPIQTAILKLIAQQHTIVGIIGDPAQSIYGFQGAEPKDFTAFSLPGLTDYLINDNWRSTDQIVQLLNHIRKDICQTSKRQTSDIKPLLLIGDSVAAYNYIQTNFGQENIATLSRDNVTANSMKRKFNANIPNHNLIDDLFSKDSNSDRRRTVVNCIKAVELAKEKQFKDALKEMSKNFEITPVRKKLAFAALSKLLLQYDTYATLPLTAFCDLVRTNVNAKISKLTKGSAASFYGANTYQEVATGVNIADDFSLNRTIHKAKGDEFENVMLILKNESDLTFVTSPNLNSTETHRIFYVAVSRAKQRLFISVPTLSVSRKNSLTAHFDFQTV